MLHKPSARLHQKLLQIREDQFLMRRGSTNRRHKFPRLY
jgi:hypothetical protein